jgi:hypothetical protein
MLKKLTLTNLITKVMRQMLQIQVLNPRLVTTPVQRRADCELLVEATKPLPTHTYQGTVHLLAQEQTATGNYPCRLLRHYQVSWVAATTDGAQYLLQVDISDEPLAVGAVYSNKHHHLRQVTESVEVICRRVAGIFGRYCQDEYRPPTVVVR